jgi:broad specificity phosphatase PhoE
MNLVIVSHGLTLRVFLMRWYKWTVEQFEGLWNFGNTGMLVMELGPGGRCIPMYPHPSFFFSFFFFPYKMYFFLPMDYNAFNKFYGN